jgi:hypothetical protein
MEINETQFIAGFNVGYLLAEFEPQILNTVLKKIQPINSYLTGISFGRKEFELEQSKSQLNELEKIRQKESNKKEWNRD